MACPCRETPQQSLRKLPYGYMKQSSFTRTDMTRSSKHIVGVGKAARQGQYPAASTRTHKDTGRFLCIGNTSAKS